LDRLEIYLAAAVDLPAHHVYEERQLWRGLQLKTNGILERIPGRYCGLEPGNDVYPLIPELVSDVGVRLEFPLAGRKHERAQKSSDAKPSQVLRTPCRKAERFDNREAAG